MSDRDKWSDVLAMQITIAALIKTHPDRPALLAMFDQMVAGMQLHAASMPNAGLTPEALRDSLSRLRKLME